MQSHRFLVAAAILPLLLLLAACEEKAALPDESPIEKQKVEITTLEPDSAVVVDQEVTKLVDEPRQHLRNARTQHESNQFAESRASLRRAAELLNDRAAHASDAVKNNVETSAQELETLAERMKEGPEVTSEQLGTALARAYTALAEYHHQQATWQLSEKRPRHAAVELNAAAVYLEDTAPFLNSVEERQATQLRTQAEDLADNLAEHFNNVAETASEQLREIGRQIEEIHHSVQPTS